MKILFLTDPDPTYGGTFLYNGLAEALGEDSVVDYPYKASNHGGIDTYPNKHLGHEGEFCQCTGFVWNENPPQSINCTLEEIRDQLINNTFDAIVCESIREKVIESLELLKDHLPKNRIALDDEDSEKIHYDLIKKYGFNLYLKRELTVKNNKVSLTGCIIKPYHLSCVLKDEGITTRNIDIFCAFGGRSSHPIRNVVARLIDDMPQNWSIDKDAMANGYYHIWGEYKKRLYTSKIVVAPRGGGFDTVRRWEASAAGALLFMEKLDLIEEHPMIDGEHCIMYSPGCHDFQEKLIAILNDNDKRERIALNGQKHMFKYHTPVARAKQLLQWIDELK